MSGTARAKVPARLDGEMLACLLRKFPDCEIEISGVAFTLEGTEFKTETLEGAIALIREFTKRAIAQ